VIYARGPAQSRRPDLYGIVIYMYWNERDHPVPHFHVYQFGSPGDVHRCQWTARYWQAISSLVHTRS
jgi:hypothetical protein